MTQPNPQPKVTYPPAFAISYSKPVPQFDIPGKIYLPDNTLHTYDATVVLSQGRPIKPGGSVGGINGGLGTIAGIFRDKDNDVVALVTRQSLTSQQAGYRANTGVWGDGVVLGDPVYQPAYGDYAIIDPLHEIDLTFNGFLPKENYTAVDIAEQPYFGSIKRAIGLYSIPAPFQERFTYFNTRESIGDLAIIKIDSAFIEAGLVDPTYPNHQPYAASNGEIDYYKYSQIKYSDPDDLESYAKLFFDYNPDSAKSFIQIQKWGRTTGYTTGYRGIPTLANPRIFSYATQPYVYKPTNAPILQDFVYNWAEMIQFYSTGRQGLNYEPNLSNPNGIVTGDYPWALTPVHYNAVTYNDPNTLTANGNPLPHDYDTAKLMMLDPFYATNDITQNYKFKGTTTPNSVILVYYNNQFMRDVVPYKNMAISYFKAFADDQGNFTLYTNMNYLDPHWDSLLDNGTIKLKVLTPSGQSFMLSSVPSDPPPNKFTRFTNTTVTKPFAMPGDGGSLILDMNMRPMSIIVGGTPPSSLYINNITENGAVTFKSSSDYYATHGISGYLSNPAVITYGLRFDVAVNIFGLKPYIP